MQSSNVQLSCDLFILERIINKIRSKLLSKARKIANRRDNLRKCSFKRMEKSIRKFDKSSIISKFDLFKIARKQKLRCALTGRKLTNDNISPDHITPKIKGGKSVPENIQLVTIEANRAKHVMTQNDFILLCQDICKFNCK